MFVFTYICSSISTYQFVHVSFTYIGYTHFVHRLQNPSNPLHDNVSNLERRGHRRFGHWISKSWTSGIRPHSYPWW